MPKRLEFPGLRDVWLRVNHRKQNALILVWGETGTGKSYLSMLFGVLLDPSFHIKYKERMIVHPLKFLVGMKQGAYPKCNVVVIEEIGTSLYSRDWYTEVNKQIIKVLQTFRNKRLIVIFNVPHPSFIDKHSRTLINFFVEAKRVDFTTRKHTFRFSRHIVSKDKEYFPLYRNSVGTKLDPVTMTGLPKCTMLDWYEGMIDDFKNKVIVAAEKKIISLNDRAKSREFSPETIATAILNEGQTYFRKNGRLNYPKVQNRFKIGGRRIQLVNEAVLDKQRKEGGDEHSHAPILN
jgi:hypothetical protein